MAQATKGDWITWRPGFDEKAEKVGKVLQVMEPVARGRGGGSGYYVRELAEGELRGPEQHVYQFEVIRTGLSPLELLARS